MGFGYVFIGYFFMLNLPVGGIDILPDIVGCFIMLFGVNTLTHYCPQNKGFEYAKKILYIFSVLSIAVLGCQFAKASNMMSDGLTKYFYTPISGIYSVVIGVFHVSIFVGIFKLAKEVGLDKLANRSRRMLVLTAAYYIFEMFSMCGLTEFIAEHSGNYNVVISCFNLTIYALGNLWLILTWALLLTCYMRICLEGDEDMPYRDNSHDRIVNYLKRNKKKK